MHDLWIGSIGSSPGTRYTLFQLLEWDFVLMQTCGLCHSPSPPGLGWSSQVTMISGGGMVVCWVVLFLSKNRMNCDYSIFSLPCESLSGRLCTVSRVCALLYHLYFCSCTATQAWLALVTRPVHGLAVACSAHMSCVLSYAETWALVCAQVWSAAALILCCPWFWTSTSVLW